MRQIHWRFLIPAGALLLTAALLLYLALFSGLPDPRRGAKQTGATPPSILITDRNGRVLYEVIDPNGSKQVPVPLSDVPLACRQATIATEDSHFYEHPGVDLIAIGRALWQNVRGGGTVSGGSTLTQQLARNLYFSPEERLERSLRRKLREAWLAWRLEQVYDKDELLALYLNTTYYGHFAVGIEAAAQAYFGVHARELDLAQCALLAGLPQSPIAYNPMEDPDAAHKRQAVVLGLMAREGQISADQDRDAKGERLSYASTPFPIAAPHFVMWVQSQLEALLGQARLREGGLRITTTLDLDRQAAAERAVERRLAQLQPCASAPSAVCDPDADPSRRVDNAALVALDPDSGAVLALVGSPNYFDPAISGAVNAALSSRQPGSAIKPLTYAAALDPARARAAGRPVWTPATLIADLRTAFMTAEDEPYVPNNYDRVYHGPVTVRAALANSYNIPAVKTLEAIGVDALIEQANALGIPWQMADGEWQMASSNSEPPGSDIPDSRFQIPDSTARYGLSLTLGGGEVRLLDLAAAYAAFANGGRRVTPYAIERVETLAGEVLLDNGAEQHAMALDTSFARNPQSATRNPQPLDPRVAYLITDILSDNNARIPAFGEGNVLEIGRPAAAKTGTTTDWRDNWTVGYTPELVAGVWVGNADNTPMKDVSGITGAGPIWHDFMVAALGDTPAQEFAQPAGLKQVEVCADSGLLPDCDLPMANCGFDTSPIASSRQSAIRNPQSQVIPCPHRRLEWFIDGAEPTEVDRAHLRIAIDARSGRPADASTPPEFLQPEIIWQLPLEYQAWARENYIAQLAPETLAQSALPAAERLQITSPDPNRIYRLDPLLPASAQEVPVSVLPGTALAAEGAPITLLVDGEPFAQVTAPEYTAWWRLIRGRHTFQASTPGSDGHAVFSAEVTVVVE